MRTCLKLSLIVAAMVVGFVSGVHYGKDVGETLDDIPSFSESEVVSVIEEELVLEPEPIPEIESEITSEPEPILESEFIYISESVEEPGVSQEDIDLIALVTMAEAEGECEEGKRLVIDTILNRVDSEHFPDTIYDVIYQPHQFTSMTNGRVDRCYVRDDIVELVKEELEDRYDSDVVFFRTTRYSDYGVPKFQVGAHYFSSYD